jgi:hypothetical protein
VPLNAVRDGGKVSTTTGFPDDAAASAAGPTSTGVMAGPVREVIAPLAEPAATMSHLPSTGPLEDITWTRNPTPGLPACNNQATSCSTSPVSKDVVAGGSDYPIGGGREVRPPVEVIKSAHFLVSEWLSARR